MKTAFLAAVAVLIAAPSSAALSVGLSRETFRNPPHEAKPHTWWHWMNGNVTKEGITADLEAMARVGIGGAQIFDAGLALPKGPVAFASDAWFDCLVHADREAKRLGIDLCIANCSGWTSSAGPWITPELSMKYVVDTTVRVRGGERFDGRLPLPKKTNGFYEDIAVLAFPEPSVAKAALRDLPDFDMQVFRGRGNFRMGAGEGGPQMPLRITDELAPLGACVASREIIDLTSQKRSDGSLVWEAPRSHAAWIVLRVGYMANGRTNRSASKAGLGLECDKLDPHALDVHFDAYVGRLLKRLPKDRALKGVLLDSYEVFGQNWTRGFERSFAEATGYPITNFLPVLAGYPVDCAARTETFLRDFRRVISTLFSRNYSGRLRARCNENGLILYCEPYGNGPFNDLEFARECDVPMSEFWRPREADRDLAALSRQTNRSYMECRWGNKALGNSKTIAATAHVWGRRIVGAEAFTSYPDSGSGRWLASPFAMKLQCDRVFSEGVNRMIFHRYVHQPWTNPTRYPGMTMAAYGAHLERTQTWWEHGAKEFFTYMARAQHLLQAGTFVGDVLVCVPGEAPEYGTDGEIPLGYDGDRCHPAALLESKVVAGGAVEVPGGTRYRVVCVPEKPSAAVTAAVARLVASGATAVPYGEVGAALKRLGCTPDFICDDRDVTWIHRRASDDDFYFVAVPNKEQKKVVCSFRVSGKVPELWDPVTGDATALDNSRFRITPGGRTEVTLDCPPLHSVFVVFRPHDSGSVPVSTGPVPVPMGPVPIEGVWEVSFREPGAEHDIATAKYPVLESWTQNENPDIRYFSGTARYFIKFPLHFCGDCPQGKGACPQENGGACPQNGGDCPRGKRVILDLGEVREIAEVTVNGRAYPAIWKPPYQVDITDSLGRRGTPNGSIDIEIKVTNLWPNRLIGDARLPDDCEWDDGKKSKGYPLVKAWPDWLLRGSPSPTGRHAFSTCRLWTADDPLLESGLLGPVQLSIGHATSGGRERPDARAVSGTP
ncbi:MAG: hypothetical protein IJL17_23060 [Kiritimatiellae bacterium]|nr:hypothetical protein [Kiritimatiellia bacterium]